jgi:hypothetical protein
LVYFVDIDSVPFSVDSVILFTSFELSLGQSMNSNTMVIWLPVNTVKLIDFTFNKDLLVGDLIVWHLKVKDIDTVLLRLLCSVSVYHT